MKKNDGETGNRSVWQEYEKGVGFNTRIGLYDTVAGNENFFIGKQWEGVRSNGLPTPVFNFLKRVVLFRVSSIVTDNIKMQASPLSGAVGCAIPAEQVSEIISAQFESLFEHNKLGCLLREYVRNASVDGDGCLYTYFDPDLPGGSFSGGIVTELVENTRVIFGNPNDRRVEHQPYILIIRREPVREVRRRVLAAGGDAESIRPDADDANNYHDGLTDDKCTVILKFWREYGERTASAGAGIKRRVGRSCIMASEQTREMEIRPPWDTGLTRYPITWLCMDYVQDCYHGQADVTGLIPNQIFVNKLFAMTMLSLMSTAYPKIVYDRTRIAAWDNRVGAAIAMNGGDVGGAAKIIDPAQVSPQISRFIELAIRYTKEFMGANDAALGDVRPENTSAILALQRASGVPMELVRQNLHQSVEDLGRIYLDQMAAYYGIRTVERSDPVTGGRVPIPFDFRSLRAMPLSLKLDVGASAYWSEITSVQTLDNLLTKGEISVIQYLERLPAGYLTQKEELVEELRGTENGGMRGDTGFDLSRGGMGRSAGPVSMPAPLLAGKEVL